MKTYTVTIDDAALLVTAYDYNPVLLHEAQNSAESLLTLLREEGEE